jgi:hypothetical protein
MKLQASIYLPVKVFTHLCRGPIVVAIVVAIVCTWV